MLLLGTVVLIVLYVVFGYREHLSVNKDNSKNWDRPELSSVPEVTPEGEDIDRMKQRIIALETAVTDLKSKVPTT